MTPVQRLSAIARNNERWAFSTPDERRSATSAARDAFTAELERAVDPDGVMDARERAARVRNLRSAYHARIALERERRKREAAVAAERAKPRPIKPEILELARELFGEDATDRVSD